MTQLIQFPLDGGGTVLVETPDDDRPQGLQKVSRDGKQVLQAATTFNAAIAQLKPVAQAIMSTLKDLSPDQIAVELAVKVTASAGIVLTSAAADAGFKVTLTWKGSSAATDNKDS